MDWTGLTKIHFQKHNRGVAALFTAMAMAVGLPLPWQKYTMQPLYS